VPTTPEGAPPPRKVTPPGGPVPESDEALIDELTTLAGHIAAATCRFLVLLGELDARGAWGDQGILSAAHWLGWRCGMGPAAAREHVRVARALRALPVTVAAFAQGRLSYSKVRAITRVAGPETEADLVEMGLHAPAHHLERLVRGLRTAQSTEDVRRRHGGRHLSWRWAEDGSLLLSGRFSPEDGALIVQVLEDRRDRAVAEMAGAEPAPEARETMFGGEDCEPLDPLVADRRSLADALLELCAEAPAEGADRPRTSRAAETVVHVTLADLCSPSSDTSGAVATGRPAALPTTVNAPGADVPTAGDGEKRLETPDDGEDRPTPDGNGRPLQALAAESLATTPRLEDGPALHPETARRLACDSGIVVAVHDDDVEVSGRTLEVGARVRKPGAALVRALWARDRGCRYPGCTRRHFIHAHHVLDWADGGLTVITNMVLLCGTHHRLLHEGGYSIVLSPDGAVTVRDRHGRLVRAVPPMAGGTDGWTPAHPVSATSLTPDWHGEPLDTSYATAVLLESWARARELAEAGGGDAQGRDGADQDCESVETDGGDDS
jgi:uncharacterized protein YciI